MVTLTKHIMELSNHFRIIILFQDNSITNYKQENVGEFLIKKFVLKEF